jgi:low affinity Fe/Cu permease
VGATGPLFGFSDTWQLIINTSTTVVTFLMVFLVQHSQNEDTREIKAMLQAQIEAEGLEDATQEKLDEEN